MTAQFVRAGTRLSELVDAATAHTCVDPDTTNASTTATLLAVQGRPECTDIRCRRLDGVCIGWHCPHCGAPCNYQGHDDCRETR